jgi:hypothetical protein
MGRKREEGGGRKRGVKRVWDGVVVMRWSEEGR